MRTTLDIDDDVLHAAKELAAREGRTAGSVLSDLARRGLSHPQKDQRKRPRLRKGVPVLESRGEIVTLDHIQRLRDREGV